jgi:hypothetical protein
MIKNKVTNISNIKLEFFVKVKNSEDTLISIEPGEVVFSDGEEMTKSMRIFERKKLISVINKEFDTVSVDTENGTILATWDKDIEKDLLDFHNIPDVKAEILNVLSTDINKVETTITDSDNPYKDLLTVDLFFEGETSIVDEAKKQAEDYVGDGEPIKEKKKYNYKKKPGRKKKRGPKPGSKRKKGE